VITEVVTFKLRAGMTREDVVAIYRKTAPIWRANPECIRKCYLYDGERALGGGAYLWKSIEAAKLAHGDAWRTMINDLYGSEDQISIVYFETPVVADNLVQRTIEEDDPSLATLAQRFRLTLEPGQRVTPTPYVTLRPEPGLHMRLERR